MVKERDRVGGVSMPMFLLKIGSVLVGAGLDSGCFANVALKLRLLADLERLRGPNTVVQHIQPIRIGTFAEGAAIICDMVVRRARVGIGDAFYELDFFGVSGAANLPYTIGLLDMIRLKMELTPHRSSLRMRLPKNPRLLMPGAVMPTKPANWRGDSEWEPFQRVHMYWKSFWVHLQLQ